MAVIDADTHVDESEATWEGLRGALAKYAPLTVVPQTGVSMDAELGRSRNRWWYVEGRLQARAIRDGRHHPPRERRELEDVAGRVQHMDELGVDVHVIFPTFFIRYNTEDPEAEYALTSTYNRWLAERCAETNGRLRWAVVLPLLSPDKAVEELRWAKAHGACGIFKRGFDLMKPVSDPHFFPIYEEAQALDLALCLHTGHPLPFHEWDRGFPIMSAFTSLVTSGIPDKFPRLRFGLIEAGASWIPYSVSMLAVQERQRQRATHQGRWPSAIDMEQDLFRKNRFYVTIDAIDDVAYLMQYGLEDSLMIGTDYSHTDVSANLSALDEVRLWADEGRITKEQARKILEENPARFYGLG